MSITEQERSAVEAAPRQLFIGGEWRDAGGGATLEVDDPSTGEAICEIADATPEDETGAGSTARGKGVRVAKLRRHTSHQTTTAPVTWSATSGTGIPLKYCM